MQAHAGPWSPREWLPRMCVRWVVTTVSSRAPFAEVEDGPQPRWMQPNMVHVVDVLSNVIVSAVNTVCCRVKFHPM